MFFLASSQSFFFSAYAAIMRWAPSGSSLMKIPAWDSGTQPCDRMLARNQAQQTLSDLARSVTSSHLGRMGG